MKKILCCIAIFVLLLTCTSCRKTYSKGLLYEYDKQNQGYIVTGLGSFEGEVLNIPPKYNYRPVIGIRNYAFDHCGSLTSVTIPDSVTTIGEHAFSSCSNLTSITIPDSVTTIKYGAFLWSRSLTLIKVDSNNDNFKSIDGNLYTKDGTKLLQYAIGKKNTSFVIPDSVTTIGEHAFAYCDLTSIIIPDSVTTIGDYAFWVCQNLISITIGDSVSTIGDYAFRDCTNLTSITIPDSVTTIGEYAFSDCDNLRSIRIPDGVTTIGEYAFSECDRLTIYCEVKSLPSGWSNAWNWSKRPVLWGYSE